MIIEKLLLREGMIENLDTFSEKRNLIYSKTNTKGKSTFVRLLFYALGYPIPNMRGIKYEDIITEIKGKNILPLGKIICLHFSPKTVALSSHFPVNI